MFAGEVGVIVLGVLLALGAQQLVADFQMRREIAIFRKTIDHEIALNLYGYEVRSRQAKCVTSRIDALTAWLEKARSGEAVPPLRPGSLVIISPYRSAWENRNVEVFANLPDSVRQKYAEFYDELANNTALMSQEVENWHTFDPYSEAGPITLEDRRTIRPALGSARVLNDLVIQNLELSRKIASDLGIRMVAPDGVETQVDKFLATCRSVIAERKP